MEKKSHWEAECSTQLAQHMKIVQSKLSGEQKKRKKKKKAETFSTAASLNRLRSAEHNPDLKN